MLATMPVHPEGPRYRAAVAYLSGLWVPPQVWLPMASFLAHRGWEGALIDTRELRGGLAARIDAVAEHLRSLSAPPIVMGHDVGALVAFGVAAQVDVQALVLMAPLLPGAAGTHAITWSRQLLWSLLRGRRLGPPTGHVGDAYFAGLPERLRQEAGLEDARLLGQLARRRPIARQRVPPPTLVLHGARDPVLDSISARRFAATIGADFEEIPDGGRWLVSAPAAPECVRRVHPWLVRQLGEPLLEFHAEAMADRDADAD